MVPMFDEPPRRARPAAFRPPAARRCLAAALAGLVLLLPGCIDPTKTDVPVRPEALRAAVQEVAPGVVVVRLTPENVAAFDRPRAAPAPRGAMASAVPTYRVGTGDILDVIVWDHPELTQPAGPGRSPEQGGLRVREDGTFFYPYVGAVPAADRTPEAIRADLSQRLRAFIPDPQVEVRVAAFRSKAVSVTGEVARPGRQGLTDIPLTLVDAIGSAGGLTDSADPRTVTIRRGGQSHVVDLEAFLRAGDAAQNPVLHAGDIVSVARQDPLEAYLLGQLVRPATIDLREADVTLTQALTRVGGLREDQADARGVFVFRDTPAGTTVYQLDVSSPLAYLTGTRFTLLPQDVVYVTTAPLSRWNRLISSLLPSLTVARVADELAGD